MTREKFMTLRAGQRIKVLRSSGTNYIVNTICTFDHSDGSGACILMRPTGTLGNWIRFDSIDVASLSRNSEIRFINEEIKRKEDEITAAKAKVEWFKLYRDSLDEALVKALKEAGIEDPATHKHLRTKLYKGLKEAGVATSFDPPIPLAPRLETLGGRTIAASAAPRVVESEAGNADDDYEDLWEDAGDGD